MIRPLFAVTGLTLASVFALRALGYGAPETLQPAHMPLEACSRVVRGAVELDLSPAWDSLPSAWQDDLNQLVDELEKGANPDLWERTFRLLGRLDGFLRAQPDLICSSARLGVLTGAPEDAPTEARATHLERIRSRAAALLTTVTESGLGDSDNLSYLDLRELATDFLPSIQGELQAINGHETDTLISPELAATLVSRADDFDADTSDQAGYIQGTRSVAIDYAPGLTRDVAFVKVDGRWCDASLASGWEAMMSRASAQIAVWTANTTSGELEFSRGLLDAFEAGMTALEEAASTEDLDAALDATTGKVGALLMRQKLKSLLKG